MKKVHSAIAIRKPRWLTLALVTFATGVGSGLGGMALALLLRLVQHIAYGHGLHNVAGRVSFLQEVTAASDLRRFLALCSCGVVAGIGWWLLYRFGSSLVSIARAVRKGGRMPFWATLTHAILQIVTVGLGSPLGREVAPRELGAIAYAHRKYLMRFLVTQANQISISRQNQRLKLWPFRVQFWFRHTRFRTGHADFRTARGNASTLPRSAGGNHLETLRKLCGM